jgi:hypothetical protein
MGFRESLDKYLTTPPDDGGFEEWCELVIMKLPDECYDEWEDLLCKGDGVVNRWLNKLYDKYYSEDVSINDMAEHSANIIERALNIFKPEFNSK